MYSLYGIHYKPMLHIACVITIQTVSSFVQACYWLELYMEICGVLAPEAGVLKLPEWVSSTWKLVLRFQSTESLKVVQRRNVVGSMCHGPQGKPERQSDVTSSYYKTGGLLPLVLIFTRLKCRSGATQLQS